MLPALFLLNMNVEPRRSGWEKLFWKFKKMFVVSPCQEELDFCVVLIHKERGIISMPWDDADDFSPADDDNDDEPDDWSEEQWEAFLREQDERSRKMMELLDKYGHDQQGFRKAMEELGHGKIFEELDRRAAEMRDQPQAEPEDEEEAIDQVLMASRYASEDAGAPPPYRHPLGTAAHELTLLVLHSLDGHEEIDSREHPLVIFSDAFLDATGGLAGAGYMREWDDDPDFPSPRNLKIVELKRALKNLLNGLSQLEKVERQKLLPSELCEPIRLRSVALLDDLRAELKLVRGMGA